MKKILLLSFVLFLTKITAQTPRAHCILDATTYPYFSPNVIQYNALPKLGGIADESFINKWAWWMDPLNPNWPYSIQIYDMGLNPGESYGPTMAPINSGAYDDHYLYLKEDHHELMNPDGGWEILSINRGYYPDDETTVNFQLNNNEMRSVPYLLFYNKYSGVARIFFRWGINWDPNSSINFASVSIRHSEGPYSGIMRLGDGIDRTLDQPTKVNSVSARVPSPGDASMWFSADFQMAYDPCVCEYDSELNIQFKFFSSSTLKIDGRAVTAQDQFSDESFMFDSDYIHDFFASLSDLNHQAQGGGVLIYRHMEKLVDDYLKRLQVYKTELSAVEAYNLQLEKQEAVLKLAKIVFTTAITAVTGVPAYTSLIGLIPALQNIPDKNTFGPSTQKAFWKEFDKVLDTGYKTYIKDDKKKKDKPTKPNMPVVSFSELSFSGQITGGTERNILPIKTPGSRLSNQINNNQPSRYPLYDEPLGIFALLEEPSVNFTNARVDLVTHFEHIGANVCNQKTTFTDKYQFQLKEPLVYAINPALKITSYDMKAGFQLIAKKKDKNIPVALAESFSFIDPIHTNNFNAIYMVDENYYAPIFNVKNPSSMHNTSHSYIGNNTYHPNSIPNNRDLQSIVFDTPMVPIDAFNSQYFEIGIKNQVQSSIGCQEIDPQPNPFITTIHQTYGREPEIELYLKIVLNVTFEAEPINGNIHEYSYLSTYKLSDNKIVLVNTQMIPISNTNLDLSLFEDDLVFGDIFFDGSEVEGCKLHNNLYTCRAKENIEIVGDISTASGYFARFQAGNIIEVLPESEISSHVVLEIVPFYDYSNPMPPASELQIRDFCKPNGRYQANTLRSDIAAFYDSLAQANPPQEIVKDPIEIVLFPNPTTGASQAGLVLPELSTVSITLMDLSGKVLGKPVSSKVLPIGRNVLNLESEPLAPGVYLVQVVVNGEKFVQRLVKQ